LGQNARCLEQLNWRWEGVTVLRSAGGRERGFATRWARGFLDKPLSRTRLLRKLYEFVFRILFLSGYVFGLVFSRRACYRLVPGFSIPVYSPRDKRGIVWSGNRGLGFGIRAGNGRFRSRNSPLDHSCVMSRDR
jgi:hypothetical protein